MNTAMIYSVFEEWPDQQWEKEVNICLFSSKAYWDLQANPKEFENITPILVKSDIGEIVAFWCFTLKDNSWLSPINAPYFEPFIAKEILLSEILPLVIQHLKNKRNLPIQCTLPPQFHLSGTYDFNEISKITYIKRIAIGNILLINPSISFSEIIAQKRKGRKLQSLLKSDFKVREAKQHEWEVLYGQLLQWRKVKNHKNLISVELMLTSKERFPELYRCLQLTINEQTAGLVFFVQSNSDSFYIYSLITDPQLKENHTSLLLWNALYNLAIKEDISHLDLGTSMLTESKINKGLFRFKLALGAYPTKKLTISC